MSNHVVIYRKTVAGAKPRKLSVAKADTIRETIARNSRVGRPALVALVLSGDFHKLPALTQAEIDSHVERRTEKAESGFVLPVSDLGRLKREADHSTAQSVLLWIKKHLSDVVRDGEVAVVIERRDD